MLIIAGGSGYSILGSVLGSALAIGWFALTEWIRAARWRRAVMKPPTCTRCGSPTSNHPEYCAACAGPDGRMGVV